MATPRHVAQLIESGNAAQLKLSQIKSHFHALDARARITLWWEGAELDRLFDARHARVVEAGVKEVKRYGFRVAPEVSFSEFGERGSIDLLAAKENEAAVLVGEAKSEWGGVEETLRRLDIKTRLAPKIAFATFGFRPRLIATVLLFPEDRTARRVADRFANTLGAALPARGNEIRRWLRKPTGQLRGIWFLTNAGPEPQPRDGPTPKRSAG